MRIPPTVVAFAAYLVLATAVWWGAWSTHPTTITTCGCGDASLFTWFIEWPAYALAHGHDPLFSTALFHPVGFNLLSNTGVLALGVALTPVTWLFGPVASQNVASTLVPALSAVSMFWLLRRWVDWQAAAFVGGLLFGFSPFVLGGMSAGWLTPLLIVPPLLVACIDELLIRQQRRPIAIGAALGGLVVVQFFLGTELLAICAISACLGLLVLGLSAAVHDPIDVRRRARHAITGLATAAVIAVALLAYPVWFALAGPAHLSGAVWPGYPPGYYGVSLPDFWRVGFQSAQSFNLQRLLGGYQGPALPQTVYLGLGLTVVVLVGWVIWHRDRRFWFFGFMGVATALLCLGPDNNGNHFWVPWRALTGIPVVRNIIPDRFVSMTLLCVAVLLGLTVDYVHRWALRWPDRRAVDTPPPWLVAPRRRLTATAIAVAVSAGALVPVASSYGGDLPFTMRPVVLPQWFADVGPHLPTGQVVLAYPAPFSGIQSSMTWQAVDRLHFAMAGGGGPEGVPSRAGRERAGFNAIASAAVSFGPLPPMSNRTIAAVRQALLAWKVTTVVVPDQPGLPPYDQGMHTAYAVGLFTAALDERPHYESRAWVWAPRRLPPVTITASDFGSCVGAPNYPAGPPDTVPNCVLAHSRSPHNPL